MPAPRHERLLGAAIVASLTAGLALLPTAADEDRLPPQLIAAVGSVAPGDPAPRGSWLAGDTHIHTDHSSDGSLPRQGTGQRGPGNNSVDRQITFGEGRDLAWMPITDHRSYDQHWDPEWTSSELVLIPGEEANGRPHATVLGHVDQVVDGANPTGSAPFRHVQQSVWWVHGEDAVWNTAHPEDGEIGVDAPNASTQSIDAIEIFNAGDNPERKIDYAEGRWNLGFRTGIVAASDSHFVELNAVGGPGQPTTRVFAANGSERAILDGLRGGRTTLSADATTGALATLEADLDGDGRFEALGGDEVLVPAGRALTLRARVQRGPLTTATIYRSPGRSVAPLDRRTITGVDATYTVPLTAPEGDTWYRLEVRGPGVDIGTGSPSDPTNTLQALTAPLFVSTGALPDANAEIPLPAPEGRRDAADLVTGARGGFSGFADVAAAGDRSHVVTELHDGGATTVRYHRLPGGAPVDLAPASDAARFPRVAARGEDVWVVWQDERSGQTPRRPDIFLRQSADGGVTWQPERQLTDGGSDGGRHMHPDLALVDAATPVVVWTANPAGPGGAAAPFDVFAQVVGVDPAPINLTPRSAKPVSPANAFDVRSARFPASLFPAVAVGPDGGLAVTFQDDRTDPDPLFTGRSTTLDGEVDPARGTDPDNWEILVNRRGAGATAWSASVSASANTDMADRHPDVSFSSTGQLVVAWETKRLRNSGVNLSLRSATSSDGGATFSAPTTIALEEEAMSQRVRLGPDPDGGVQAVWSDTRGADWRWEVLTASDAGSGWSAAERLTGDGSATWPAVDGGRVVFTSDRAARSQRDRTEQVFILGAEAGDPDAVIPEAPVAALFALAALGLFALATTRRRRSLEVPCA